MPRLIRSAAKTSEAPDDAKSLRHQHRRSVIIPHLFDLSKQLNFTLNYNGTIQKQAQNQFSTVPTLAERSAISRGSPA